MADQEHEFASEDLQGDVVEGRLVRLSRVHLGHMIERDDGRTRLLRGIFDLKRRKRRGQLRCHLSRRRSMGACAPLRAHGSRMAHIVRHSLLHSYSDVL